MARLWPLLVILAALVLVIVLFVLPDDDDASGAGLIDHVEEEAYVAPELRGLPASERAAYLERKRLEEERRAAEEAAKAKPEPAASPSVLVKGVVLDAEEGKPLPGVLVWWETARQPCPRMAQPFHNDSDGKLSREGWPVETARHTGFQIHTNARGQFGLTLGGLVPAEPPTSIDVFAWLPGRVFHVTCAVAVPGEIEIRLEKGLTLKGRVTNTRGRAIQGASVRVRPAPETPDEPGHSTPFTPPGTNAEGTFAVTGLVPGAVMLEVDHPEHMPQTVGPHDPADGETIEVRLVPALRAKFHIRTDDGRAPEHPTLVWKTVEPTPRGEVYLLRPESITATVTPDGPVEGDWTSQSVRLPCDAPSLVLQVKADGYGTWASEPLRLPPEGGEETYEVKLSGDYATGKIKLSLEDDTGEKVHYANARVELQIGRLDPGTRAAAYVLEQREDLIITDLPAGMYRLFLRSAGFAPETVDMQVFAGQEAESLIRVRPPAKLKVRFIAPDPTLVRFRLTQNGEIVFGVPEGDFSRGTDEKTGEPILTAGADGLLLSGLAAGSYQVEVLSEDLTAPSTLVHLKEGDTTEAEIHVRPR